MNIRYIVLSAALATAAAAFALTPQKDPAKPLWGCVDASGQWVIKPKFESIEQMGQSTMIVRQKGKYGVIHESGTFLVKPELQSLTPIEGSRYLADRNSKFGILDADGSWLIQPIYDRVDTHIPGYYRVKKGNKAGLYSKAGMVIIEPKEFTSLEPFGNYWKASKNGAMGLYDPASHGLITRVEYTDVDCPITIDNRTYVPVKTQGWTVADNTGKLLLEPSYEKITAIEPLGAIMLEPGGSRRFLFEPATGEQVELIGFTDKAVGPFRTIAAGVKEWQGKNFIKRFPGSRIAVITDADGNIVSAQTADIDIIDNRYIVREGSTCSVFDATGNQIADGLPVPYERTGNLIIFGTAKALMPVNTLKDVKKVGKLIAVADNGKYTPILDGHLSAEAFEEIAPSGTDHLLTVRKDGKWGLISDDGVTFHPCDLADRPVYNSVLGGFDCKEGDKVGLLGLIPARYDEITVKENYDAYFVRLGDQWGIYSTDGRLLIEPTYTVLNPNGLNDHMWAGLPGDRWGVVDCSGNVIVPVNYPDACLNIIDGQYYEILQNGATYYNSAGEKLSGKEKVEVQYQNMVHNNWDSNGNKGFKLEYDFDTEFLLEKPIYVEIQVFNKNGTPARNNKGGHIKYGTWKTPSYLFARFEDQWFTMPYAQFTQPSGTKRDYYVQLKFFDENKRPIPTTGNSKIEFYMTR